jgi:O-antigen ligase
MSRLNNVWISIITYTFSILILLPFIPITLINLLGLSLGYILLIGIFYPRSGLFLFLLTRPALDYFTDQGMLSLFSYEINLASLWGVAALILATRVVYANFNHIRRIPLSKPWMIFLLIVLATIPFSIHTTLSIRELTRILTIVAFFVLGYSVITENKHFTTQIKVIIFSILAPGTLAYYQFFTDSGLTLPLENIYNRIYGTFAHPNLFAFYLIIPLVLSLIIVLIKNKKEMATYGFGILMAGLLGLLVLTYTRGAWIAFLLAVLTLGIIRYRKVLLIGVVVFTLLYATIPTVQERAARVIKPDPYGSIVWRLGLWEDGFNYTLQKPILGHGAGTAKDVIAKNRGEAKGSPHPHNDYLKIALEYGFLGLAAYLYLLISALVLLYKTYKAEERVNFKNIYLGILALTFTIFLMSFGDNMIRNTALQWTLWSLIGGALALRKK